MVTQIPIKTPGVASFETSDVYTTGEVFSAALPLVTSEDFPVAPSTTLEAFSVVGLDGAGNLALAKTTAPAVAPIGVLIVRAATGAVGERVPVWRSGCFNPDALVWHADYATDAARAAAFRGAPAPTNVLIRKRL